MKFKIKAKMIFKQPNSALSNQSGFTLVELLVVTAILAVLAGIALMQLKHGRERAFDSEALSIIRGVLISAAADEPIGNPGDSHGPQAGGNLGFLGYSNVVIPNDVWWSVINDGTDKWRFWFAHLGGKLGYYCWVPGDGYGGALDNDGSGNRSDMVYVNAAYRTNVGL